MAEIIKAKERTNANGFKYLSYKQGNKILCEICFPNEFADGFRLTGCGWCYDLHPTIDKPKASAESYLNRIFSAFGGCTIVYL